MARSVALSTIFARARDHADMTSSGFASDAKCLRLINDIYPRLYDELVASNENYYVTSDTISISSDARSYDLPDDFYKLIGVDYSSDNGSTYFTLYPYPEGERNVGFTTSNLPSGTIRLRYVPAPATFTSASDTLDGVAGWDRMLSLLLAIDLLDSEETSTDRLYRKYEEEIARIRTGADRDLGMPATVNDVYKSSYDSQFSWLRYRLYGDTIEFLSSQYVTDGALY
jgi:hypothetical protein